MILFWIWALAFDGKGVPGTTAEAFAALYERFLPKVFRFVNYRIADTDTAENLTSLVFEKALTKFDTYKSDKAAFSTWVFSIARNVVTDHFRDRGKMQTVGLKHAESVSDGRLSPDEHLVRTEELQKLMGSIASLSGQEKDIIALKFGGELTNRQIARNTGLSETNVGTIIYRAVRKLRSSFMESRHG